MPRMTLATENSEIPRVLVTEPLVRAMVNVERTFLVADLAAIPGATQSVPPGVLPLGGPEVISVIHLP